MVDISKIDIETINGLLNKLDEINTKLINLENRRYVVETWSEGTEWYRVWSDGWIEQGGESNGGGETLIFKKPFLTANYTTLVTPLYYK